MASGLPTRDGGTYCRRYAMSQTFSKTAKTLLLIGTMVILRTASHTLADCNESLDGPSFNI